MGKIATYAHYFQDYLKHGDITSIFQSMNYILLGKVKSKERIVRTSIGNFYCRAGTLDFQFANETYEYQIKELIQEKIKEGYRLFFDVGACIGEHSINAAGCGARVFAFDPVPQNYKVLNRNIQLNKMEDHITAYNYALGEREYLAFFEFNPVNTGMSKRVDRKTELSSEVKPFNKTWAELGLSNDEGVIIKIDVEGMEADVIEGALKTFSEISRLFIIFEDKHSNLAAIIQQLDSIGNFQYCRIDKYNMSALKLK